MFNIKLPSSTKTLLIDSANGKNHSAYLSGLMPILRKSIYGGEVTTILTDLSFMYLRFSLLVKLSLHVHLFVENFVTLNNNALTIL